MSLKKQAISGIFWTFLQQFSNRIITFLVSIVLARLLLPEEFGLIAMISVFYSIARILIESGLTQSIIRSDDVDEEEGAQRSQEAIAYFHAEHRNKKLNQPGSW